MKSALLAMMAALVLLVPPVASHGGEWEEEGRDVRVDVTADTFELRSDRTEGEGSDQIRFRLDGDNIRFRLDFREDATDLTAEAELRVELERVFEFRDADGDGGFQDGEDVRSEHQASDLELLNLTSSAVSSGGVDGIQAAATYRFRDAPGSTLTFRATVFGDAATFQGLPLDPVDVKVDFLFDNFPYRDGDTLPALEARVDALAGTSNLTLDAISFAAGNLTATFRWEDNATVDGSDLPVRTTVRPDGAETLLVTFAYARGDDIVHDPTLGFSLAEAVVTTARILGNLAFYAVGAVAAVVLFAGVAYGRRGRKVKGSGPG